MAAVSVHDIGRACDLAHHYDARVYATVNTLIGDDELSDVERMIHELWQAGVDALIVQDLSLLRLDLPPIALHASTQCDIRTPEKAAWLEALGFTQLVLARELSLREIAAVRAATAVPLEAFVHGALCVCYSGRCSMSYMANGRSANRGECAQMCRLPYDLVDCNGNILEKSRYLLSLRDLRLDDFVPALIQAGVTSFKIEGRLKDVGYVKNVVAHYRDVLDTYIAANSDTVCRSSFGSVERNFMPAVSRSFNRGSTTYFIDREHRRSPLPLSVACLESPKSHGERVGVVKQVASGRVRIVAETRLRAGDGICFMPGDGTQHGFRVNRVGADGVIFPYGMRVAPEPGTVLYRSRDKQMDDVLSGNTASRRIKVSLSLGIDANNRPMLDCEDERGCHVTVCADDFIAPEARSDQGERQCRDLGVTDERYLVRCVSPCGARFVPASVLTRLRREGLVAIEEQWGAMRHRLQPGVEHLEARCPSAAPVSSDNVANRLAEQVYRDHGVSDITPAIEVQHGKPVYDKTRAELPLPVMTTRYCILRELGHCRAGNAPWGDPLYLVHGRRRYRLHFNCARCEMEVLNYE